MEESAVGSFKVVIIGGSAGSLEVMLQILPNIHSRLNCAFIIVLHRQGGDDTLLEELIALKSPVPVKEVEDKVSLLPGYIYIAPSDYHLLFEKNGLLSLDTSEKVNYSRPSIDVSFESAAQVYTTSLTAILLSGANADGTYGLQEVKNAGGVTIVQRADTAEIPFMPQNAIDNAFPDYILGIDEILEYIKEL